MVDNLRRYQAIRKSLSQIFCDCQNGNMVRHLNTLAALINGIVGSKSCQLPSISSKMVDHTQADSRIKKYYRWLKNEHIDYETYYLPYLSVLLSNFQDQRLPLAIDCSGVGSGCMCLMMSLLYKNRALPLIWHVFPQPKGHLPQTAHIHLINALKPLIPPEKTVVLVADGEFDGVDWLQQIENYHWHYVCRSAKNSILIQEGEQFRFKDIGTLPGTQYFFLSNVFFTAQTYGPINALLWWNRKYKKPIYLLTNIELAQEACFFYKKRFLIETFFSDQKSRGFNLHKSHLNQTKRLEKLLIAAALAYIWMIYLGEFAKNKRWNNKIYRTNRNDLSLFQIGLRTLEYVINHSLKIYVKFEIFKS